MFESAKIKPGKKDSAVLGALAYLSSIFVGFLGPLLIYLLAKDDKFARFHALQSIIFQVAFTVVMIALFVVTYALMIVIIGVVCIPVIFLVFFAGFALEVYCTYLAYQGQSFKLPYIGDMALQHA